MPKHIPGDKRPFGFMRDRTLHELREIRFTYTRTGSDGVVLLGASLVQQVTRYVASSSRFAIAKARLCTSAYTCTSLGCAGKRSSVFKALAVMIA